MKLIILSILGTVVVINSYRFVTTPVGGAGNFIQEDGTSKILQQDGTSKIQLEFGGGGNLLQQDGTSRILQQDGTSKIRQE